MDTKDKGGERSRVGSTHAIQRRAIEERRGGSSGAGYREMIREREGG